MIVIADPDGTFRSWVAEVLDQHEGLVFVDGVPELTDFLGARGHDVDVVLVGPGVHPDEALTLASDARDAGAVTGVIIVARTITADLLRHALRAGVRDVLPTDVPAEELDEVVGRTRETAQQLRHLGGSAPPGMHGRRGSVVTVFSSKGGCGKSVLASNLAILLARTSGQRVALVDLDLESGDLAIMFQVLPALTIFEAAEKAERLDAEALSGYLTTHQSGVDLLAAPPEPSLAGAVTGEAVHRIVELLRDVYPYVVIDGPASFTDQLLAALDATDELVLVTSLDVPSVKNLKLAMHALERLGWDRDRLKLVLNRADSRVGLRVSDVERTVGASIDLTIPSSRDVPLSVNEGHPVAARRGRSPLVDALGSLAGDLHARHGGAPDDGGRGLLSRLTGGRA